MKSKQDELSAFTGMVVALQVLEQKAAQQGLYITARAINAAVCAAGYEKAGNPDEACKRAIERISPEGRGA